jgi:hypothetical protein
MSSKKPGGTSSCLPLRGLGRRAEMVILLPTGPLIRRSTHPIRITPNSPLIKLLNCFPLLISPMPSNCWRMVQRQRLIFWYVLLKTEADDSQRISLDTICSWTRITWTHFSLSLRLRMMACRLIRVAPLLLNLCRVLRWGIMDRVMGICCLSSPVNTVSPVKGLLGGDVAVM